MGKIPGRKSCVLDGIARWSLAVCIVAVSPSARTAVLVPNEDKAYGELGKRIVERIRLWPGLAPHETESRFGRYAYDEKIGAVGFSAGAHLAAISATSSQDALYERIDALDDISAHLNFSIPVYPAYVADDGRTGPNAHGGDGAAILPEFKFDAKTPPMFMLHGDKDYYSPMASVLIYTELHKRKIPAQLFVYANVSHGLGNTPNAKGWQNRIVDWIDSIGF